MIKKGEITRYIGDVIAGVVATTEDIAREAVKLFKVEYDVLTSRTFDRQGVAGQMLIVFYTWRSDHKDTLPWPPDPLEEVGHDEGQDHGLLQQGLCIMQPCSTLMKMQ